MKNSIHRFDWTVDDLKNGCLLASIAHSIMVAHYPLLTNEHSWNDRNYSVQNSSGIRGTITFFNGSCVAAFRDENSNRIRRMHTSDPKVYLSNAPMETQNIAENEALLYLLESVDGIRTPVITCAFWGNKDGVFSIDTFDEFMRNGGSIIESHLLDFRSAVSQLTEYYEMSQPQVALLRSIYNKKTERPDMLVHFSRTDIDMIGCNDMECLQVSIASFEQIGVVFDTT